ncbi:MAG: hypothetical protein SGJ09_07015 [Phycisphaerae bacterium]|nr:hypothetical protein [Phycisphaerae bacterium]
MKLTTLPRRAGEDGFAELARDAQDGPLAVLADTDGDEDGAADDGAAVPDPLVSRADDEIGDEIGDSAERTSALILEVVVEFLGEAADLRAGDVSAAERFGDLADVAGGDALDVHLGIQVIARSRRHRGPAAIQRAWRR